MGYFLLEIMSTKGISPLILVKLIVFSTKYTCLKEAIEVTLLDKALSSLLTQASVSNYHWSRGGPHWAAVFACAYRPVQI
jgi:hypothetical protein